MPRAWSRMTVPWSISMTRRRIVSTMSTSWVAMTTVVPVRLIRSSRRHDALARRRVEVPGRLVGEKDERTVDKGPGDGDPLLFAAGELLGQSVALLAETDEIEHLRRPGSRHVDAADR